MGKELLRAAKRVRKAKKSGSKKIRTSLYDLVEAVMDEADPSEKELVTSVVVHMLGGAKTLFLCAGHELLKGASS